MSKWLFPTQDWGKVTKQPLVTRVHGVKGDEPARQIVASFENPINHFLAGQTQLRSNSGLDVYASHQMLDGIKVNYTYQNGMEYLDIYVSRELARQLETVEDWWNFALVELVIPDALADPDVIRLVCYAHMTSPVEAVLTETSALPFAGVASITDNQTAPDQLLNAANSATPITHLPMADNNLAASFTVDLRPMRGGAGVVEIYPYLVGSEEFIPSAGVGWGATTFLVASQTGEPTVPDRPPTFIEPFVGDDAPLGATIPAVHFDRSQGEWVFDANGTDRYVEDRGYAYSGIDSTTGDPVSARTSDAGLVPGTVNTLHGWYLWGLGMSSPYLPPYSGPARVPAKLNMTLFQGTPPLVGLGYYTDGITPPRYVRWGDHFGRTVVGMFSVDTSVPVYINSTFPPAPYHRLQNFFGVPKLGDALLDTHRLIRGRPDIIENVTFKQV